MFNNAFDIRVETNTDITNKEKLEKVIKQLNKLNNFDNIEIDFKLTIGEVNDIIQYYFKKYLDIDFDFLEVCINNIDNKEIELDMSMLLEEEINLLNKQIKQHFGIDMSKRRDMESILRIMFMDSCLNSIDQYGNLVITYKPSNIYDNWLFEYYLKKKDY